MGGAGTEFETIDLGDERRNKRAIRLVYVADREADIMALMVKAQGSCSPADWLVRSQHNRALKGGDKLTPFLFQEYADFYFLEAEFPEIEACWSAWRRRTPTPKPWVWT